MKLLIVPGGTPETPSTRQRVYLTLPYLARYDVAVELFGSWDLTPPIPVIPKTFYKPRLLWKALRSDVVFVQRVLLPSYFTRLLHAVNPRIVFNFDDALFTVPVSHKISQAALAERNARLECMLRHSALAFVPNQYLADYAMRFCKNVKLIPVPVDCNRFRPLPDRRSGGKIVIGWTGRGDQSADYLDQIVEPLRCVSRCYPIELIVTGVRESVRTQAILRSSGLEVQMYDWVDYDDMPTLIASFDIGVVPLLDDAFSRGKFPLKALEYMACGVPAICTPIGIDLDIMKDGVNCMLVSSQDEWSERLIKLCGDADLRRRIGLAGRRTAESRYSFEVVTESLVDSLCEIWNG